MTDLVMQMLVKADTAGAVTSVRSLDGAVSGLRAGTQQSATVERQATATLRAAETQYRATGIAARGMSTDLRTLSASSGAAGANISNLTFQIQDVAMMAATGQAPLATMLQQGPQIASVFDQMRQSGQRVGPAILGALTSLISPMSLLTLGVVAGGAALIQWGMAAFGAGEDAADLGEQVEGLTELVKAYQSAVEEATAGNLSLIPDYGSAVGQARELLELQRQMAQVAAERAAADTSMMLAEMFGGSLEAAQPSDGSIAGNTGRLLALGDIGNIIGVSADENLAGIEAVAAALDDLGTARGPAEQARAMAELRRVLLDATGGVALMKEEVFALYQQLLDAEGATLRLSQATTTPRREPDFAQLADEAANQKRVALISEVLALEREAAAVAAERAATDTAAAEALLADLGEQVALQSMIAEFGEDHVAVARLRAQMERANLEELVNSSTAAQDLKDQLMLAYDTAASLAAVDTSSGIAAAANSAAALAANLGVALSTAQAMLQSGYETGPVILDPRDPRYDAGAAARATNFGFEYGRVSPFASVRNRVPVVGAGAAGGVGGGGGAASVSELDRLRDRAAEVLEDLALVSEQVGLKVEVGLLTAAEGVTEVEQSTERAANELADLIPEIARIGPEGAASAEEFRAKLEELVGQIGEAGSELSANLSGAFQSSFADFLAGAKSGEDAFKSFANSIRREIADIMAQRFTNAFVTPLIDSVFGSLFASARGNVIGSGRIIPFAKGGMPGLSAHSNSIVTGPTLFPMQGGLGLMGEEDPEAILPLKDGGVLALGPAGPQRLGLARGPGGELGVVLPDVSDLAGRVYARGGVVGGGGATGGARESGGSAWTEQLLGALRDLKGAVPVVNITNTAGDVAQASGETRMEGEMPIIDVLVERVVNRLGQDLRRGGPFARNFEGTYGIGRRGT